MAVILSGCGKAGQAVATIDSPGPGNGSESSDAYDSAGKDGPPFAGPSQAPRVEDRKASAPNAPAGSSANASLLQMADRIGAGH